MEHDDAGVLARDLVDLPVVIGVVAQVVDDQVEPGELALELRAAKVIRADDGEVGAGGQPGVAHIGGHDDHLVASGQQAVAGGGAVEGDAAPVAAEREEPGDFHESRVSNTWSQSIRLRLESLA